jgi:hypothetical protein
VAGETCPYCQQEIPNERVAEIRARHEADKQRQERELNTRVEAQVVSIRTQLDDAKKAEIALLGQQHATALEQQKAEALSQQNAAREEGKKLAEAGLLQQIENLTAAQATAAAKSEQLEEQRLAAVTELVTVKAQKDAEIAARTAEVRAAMEVNKVEEINVVRAQHATEAKALNDQIAALQRRVEAEEAEGADLNVLELLKKQYPKDEFRVVSKASGANLVHVIKNNKKICGSIVYDTRNRDAWNPKFASNLRDDMVAENAAHALLTTGKFPKGVGHVHICEGVVCVNPARLIALAEILRNEIVRSHSQRLSAEGRERKTEKLYNFITSDEFENLIDSMESNDEKLLQLEVDEKRAHDAMWKKRGTFLTSLQRLHSKMRERIETITEASSEDNV